MRTEQEAVLAHDPTQGKGQAGYLLFYMGMILGMLILAALILSGYRPLSLNLDNLWFLWLALGFGAVPASILLILNRPPNAPSRSNHG